MQESLHTTHAVAGLLGTIPVLCMGLFAPPAAYLGARVGTRAAIALSVLLIGAFGVARAIAPSATFVVLLTWPIGVGMGLAGALVPVAVKENFPLRPAGPTGVYTTECRSARLYLLPSPCRSPCGTGDGAPLVAFSLVTIAMAGVWLRSRATRQPKSGPRRARPSSPGIATSLGCWSRSFADGVHVLRHQRLAT